MPRPSLQRARRELLDTAEIVHQRTTKQVSALTTQEPRIARLAADGNANPEIAAQLHLSVRTVGMWFCSPRRRAPGQATNA